MFHSWESLVCVEYLSALFVSLLDTDPIGVTRTFLHSSSDRSDTHLRPAVQWSKGLVVNVYVPEQGPSLLQTGSLK